MKTITFYSYKGGVGRTMALANIAHRLAQKGKKIGMMDLDLEAPGLSLMLDFVDKNNKSALGISAFLKRSDDEIKKDSANAARKRANISGTDDERNIGIGRYCHWINSEKFKYPGKIIFLPVDDTSFSLTEFIESDSDGKGAERLLEIQKGFAALGCEYLLVDSRTGLCGTSRIASILYPDIVIMLLGLNKQNLIGTANALSEFSSSGADDIFYILPSLIPYGEEKLKEQAFNKIKKQILKKNNLPDDRLLIDFSRPYNPQVAIEDRPMVIKGVANLLSERYDQLTEKLISLNNEDPLSKMEKAKQALIDNDPSKALELIGPFFEKPPFDDNIDFLKLYGQACTKKGVTVEAKEVIGTAMRLEAEEDKKSGVPTIRTTFIEIERLEKVGGRHRAQLSLLLEAKEKKYRGTEDDISVLYGKIISIYQDTMDLPGLIKWNKKVIKEKPEFAASAATIISSLHMSHGEIDRAKGIFQETYKGVMCSKESGLAKNRDLAFVLDRWSKLFANLRLYDKAIEKLIEANEFFQGRELIGNIIDIGNLISKDPNKSFKDEVYFFENALENIDKKKSVRIIKRIVELYEEDNRIAEAIELRKELLDLEKWNQRDEILYIRRLQKENQLPFDDDYEKLAQDWLDKEPGSYFNIMTLAELVYLRGDITESMNIFINGAKQNQENREILPRSMTHIAEEVWETRGDEAIATFIDALKDTVFKDSIFAKNALSKLYRLLGHWDDSLKELVDCLKLTGAIKGSLNYFRLIVQIIERRDRWNDAISLIKEESKNHIDDIEWPIFTAEFYIRAAVVQKGKKRQQFLDIALDILQKFEKKTGPMQLDKILPVRYHIIVEILGDSERAWKDFENIKKKKFENQQIELDRAMPIAKRFILLSLMEWDEVEKEIEQQAYFAKDEDAWESILLNKADLYFMADEPANSLKTLERLKGDQIKNSMAFQFLQLRCYEATNCDVEVEIALNFLRKQFKEYELYEMSNIDLAHVINYELRCKENISEHLEKVKMAVKWLDVQDINYSSARVQSSVALYHFTFGSRKIAKTKLKRLKQIGYYHRWKAEFLHDIKTVSKIHGIPINLDEIRRNFPQK
ncbi:MAG: P-loop NTPase [Desulfobacteraceae bacterium]|nr:P-loop NTPase [Desulfobacteraceae bacterium]